MFMKKIVIAILIVISAALPANAKTTFSIPSTYTQSEFKDLSTELGLAISYVPLSPAEPLGDLVPGIDVGIELTGAKISNNSKFWTDFSQGSSLPEYLPFPKVHVQFGFPAVPIDLGLVYSQVPDTDIKVIGGEIKYAILKGGTVMPAVAVRAAYTKLSGIDDIDISTKSLDLSISKGILMFTPYAGVSEVWITSTPKPSVAGVNLEKEDLTETKPFLGLKVSFLPIFNIVAEADFGKVEAYSLRLNLHF
jgi:hypothetical protein